MASGHSDDEEESHEISRRDAIRGGGITALSIGTLGLFGSTGAEAAGEYGTVIDLGEQGLSSGDEIDPYIDQYFTTGNEVHIPPGRYEWNGTLFGPDAGPGALIGDGDVGDVVFEVNDTLEGYFRHDSGEVLLRNVTFRGENPEPKAGITIGLGEDGTFIMEHVRAPDGATKPEDRFMYAETDHYGTAYIRNSYWRGFGNNGGYTDNGRVVYENCVAHNNNISGMRLGFGDGDVYNCLIVVDGPIPDDGENASNGRGLRFRNPGNHTVENCDLLYRDTSGAGAPIELRAAETAGVLRNCRIYNETGRPVVKNKSEDADWSAENVHLSGSGNLDMEGVDEGNVIRGENAVPPRTDFEEFLGAPIDITADDGPVHDTSGFDHTVVLHASADNPDPVPELSLTVTGEAAHGDEAEAGTDLVTQNDDGTTTVTSVDLDPDALDSYRFDGEVVDYSLPDGYDVDVSLDGSMTSFEDLVPSYDNTIVLHAAADNPDPVPEVSLTMSGDATYGDESESGTDLVRQNDDGTTTVMSIDLDPDALDSYLFDGDVVDYTVSDGYAVDVTLNGSATSFEDLVGSDDSTDGSSGDDSTDDGSTDDGSSGNDSTDDGSTDNGSSGEDSTDDGSSGDDGNSGDDSTDRGSSGDDSTDDGSTDDGSSGEDSTDDEVNLVGDLPYEVEFTSTGRSISAYTITVSRLIRKDSEKSSGSGRFDQVEDVARDGKVLGAVQDGSDVYQYSGRPTELTVDGDVDVEFRVI